METSNVKTPELCIIHLWSKWITMDSRDEFDEKQLRFCKVCGVVERALEKTELYSLTNYVPFNAQFFGQKPKRKSSTVSNDDIPIWEMLDKQFLPVLQEGWRWIGNSSKETSEEAIEEYAQLYLGQTLMAIDFGPGGPNSIVKWSVHVEEQ